MSGVEFHRAQPSAQSVVSSTSTNPPVKESSTSEVAGKTFVKGVAPQMQTPKDLSKIAAHRPAKSFPTLRAILHKIFPFLFKENVPAAGPKLDLKKVPQENRSIVAARHLIASFTHKDLTTEGIFRVPGNTALVRASKAAIGRGRMPDVEQMNPRDKANLISSLLKDVEFFNDQGKEVLLGTTIPHIEKWENDKENDVDYNFAFAYRTLATQIGMMPNEQKELLRDLVFLCDDINDHSKSNLMPSSNLATNFAPSLLPLEAHSIVEATDQIEAQQKLSNFILGLSKEDKQFLFNS